MQFPHTRQVGDLDRFAYRPDEFRWERQEFRGGVLMLGWRHDWFAGQCPEQRHLRIEPIGQLDQPEESVVANLGRAVTTRTPCPVSTASTWAGPNLQLARSSRPVAVAARAARSREDSGAGCSQPWAGTSMPAPVL